MSGNKPKDDIVYFVDTFLGYKLLDWQKVLLKRGEEGKWKEKYTVNGRLPRTKKKKQESTMKFIKRI